MTANLLPWPEHPLAGDRVVLRRADERDVAMARSLSTDPYVPAIGSLPPDATPEQARAWIARQRDSRDRGAGYSFTIVDDQADAAVGNCGLWLRALSDGRATAGYALAPGHRGRGLAGDALRTLTAFAAELPGLHRVELYIEPWNSGSVQTAESAGYGREGLLRSHQWISGSRRDMLLYARIVK
ncbi:GNAT family N-acetyltransferase [Brevibacterium jeotgali]|uniref:Protein N-acetyltransferase, RimJ/RimL family n=1 Tax=Brevibacterium jeotgali TaxID=1262550 RepID=A0A2H1L6C0_9MICO|nr:GNAT family protein [Brevibacterium jeotgali]TWC03596.1 RimJ/RimL family protein N-acetyltransferase [Brevibacterium jeotgali]SMY12419.1 Protein N-acetyltransferase, RimJ/RimL family [Brevibacterium jeotgali]